MDWPAVLRQKNSAAGFLLEDKIIAGTGNIQSISAWGTAAM